ncbi:hypothetical protein CBER1_07655 [Cercospora berteroae]|uniref:C2H2-type domain-containing protein n=1 Tax=Cercospora berteroae TaxID=357750 RepID=A0A2S6C4L3_9PEZI|nr:hypothetical protein CBER1_07655 [Cercospora berteroae]
MTAKQYPPRGVIADRIESCVNKFESTIKRHQDKSQQGFVTSLTNEQYRFKAWVSQAATDTPAGQNGLDYSLRDTEGLRDRLLSLLQDLANNLDRACGVVEDAHNEGSAAVDDEDGEDNISLDFEYDSAPNDPAAEHTRHIVDTVSQLYRVTLALRTPAGIDYLKSAEASTAFGYQHFDEEHVRQDFPSAPEFLIKRLAECISRHRQLLKHRQNNTPDRDHCTSDDSDSSIEDNESGLMGVRPPSEVARTEASAITINTLWRSTASVASRPRLHSAPVLSLRLPQMPQRQGQEPLRCPICFLDVSVQNEKQWRNHVFDDLQPYVCTYEICASAHRAYSSAHQWKQHMISAHPISWRCPLECDRVFTTVQDLETHVVEHHKVSDDAMTLKTVSDACADPHDVLSSRRCALCQCVCPSQRHWFKHIQEHQQQLALFSLPQHLLVAASDDESDGTEIEETTKSHSKIRFGGTEDKDVRDASNNLERESSRSSWEDLAMQDSREKVLHELKSEVSDKLERAIDIAALLPLALSLHSTGRTHRQQDQREELESRLIKLLAATMSGRSKEEREAIVAKFSERLGTPYSIKVPSGGLGIELQKRKERRDRGRRERLPEVPDERQDQSIGQGFTGVGIKDPLANDVSRPAPTHSTIDALKQQPPEQNSFQEHERHIQAVSFCDAFGAWYRFPFSTVRNWAGMQQCVLQASKVTGEDHETLVRDGKYSLIDSTGHIILPDFWSINVWPGLAVHMQMWSQPQTSEKSKATPKKRSKRHNRKSSSDQDWSRLDSSAEELPSRSDPYEKNPHPTNHGSHGPTQRLRKYTSKAIPGRIDRAPAPVLARDFDAPQAVLHSDREANQNLLNQLTHLRDVLTEILHVHM